MIGKPEWFERRKYTGWGLTPKTWQGWAYIGIVAAPIIVLPFLHLEGQLTTYLMLGWAGLMAFDVLDIMLNLKQDEREKAHEAIAERNAAWAMIAVLTIGIAYQAASSAKTGILILDPFLVIAVAGGLAAKAFTNWKLAREN